MTTEHRYDAYTGANVAHGVPATASASVAMGLEPPRYCTWCGRRMVVQIMPDAWTARCARHGVVDSAAEGARR